MKQLKSKDGFSYLMTCVIILGIALFLVAVMQYGTIYHVVGTHKDKAQLDLNSYVTKSSIEYYDALKQGKDYGLLIDTDELVVRTYAVFGFDDGGNAAYRELTDGQIRYRMSRPKVEALTDGSIGVSVRYTLTIPFEVLGQTITDIEVPVEIVSKLKKK